MLEKLKNELVFCPTCKTALRTLSVRGNEILRRCVTCKAHITDIIVPRKEKKKNEDK